MDSVLQILKEEFHLRTIDESLVRVNKCVHILTADQLWAVPNKNCNSVGNLVLHLGGNIRQYIVAGIGGAEDLRQRNLEFQASSRIDAEELLRNFSEILVAADKVVSDLSFARLSEQLIIQGFEHTVLSAMIHVVEHLSYHVGQITYYTKLVLDIDTAYYGGMDLNATK